MNISFNKEKLENSLSKVNSDFREKIIDTYIELKKRYVRSFYSQEFDTVGLSSGKFCEILFRFLENEIFGSYTPFDKHISNFPAAVNNLSQTPASQGNESIRVIVPRALIFIYTLRNKRGIGHVGGGIVANSTDISTIIKSIDWIVCELIRLYHNLSLEEAQLIIDSLNIKILPDIWNVNGTRRVIREGLNYSQKVIILLYNENNNKANIKELLEWTEYSSPSIFKSKVIMKLHKEKLIEFTKSNGEVHISPIGINYAETILYRE